VRLDGRPIDIRSPADAVKHGIAYVPEDRRRHGVILEMPIADNMTMAVHERIFPGTWLRPAAERSLAERQISDLGVKTSGPDATGGSLSGGNQQKVSLARWLATGPRLLILDEPTQGVDVGAKSEIHKIIRRLADEGMAVLLISSDLPEVLGMADRIAVMRGGTITAVFPGGSDEVRIDLVQEAVARHYGISIDELVGDKRTKRVVEPRQVAMYLSRELTDASLPAIGRAFGGRDHTTVIYAVQKMTKQMGEQGSVYEAVQTLTASLTGRGNSSTPS
jgi:ABC-type multidrug transport system ATPase subunit